MYYKLTEKEYKEYMKEFNKTYIGKLLHQDYLVAFITGCILLFASGGFIGFKAAFGAFEVTLFNIALFLIGGFAEMESIIKNIKYKDELKEFIIEKNKKTKE